MARIFVSYRRTDTGEAIGRVIDALKQHLPPDAIFFDRVDILPGQDFRLELYRALGEADVVIAAIGPRWLQEFEQRRRLDDSKHVEDHLLVEIETALRLGKLVLPLLIDVAEPPDHNNLPTTIRELGRLNMRALDVDNEEQLIDFAGEVMALLNAALQKRFSELSRSTGIEIEAFDLILRAIKNAAAAGDDVSAPGIWRAVQGEAEKNFGERWRKVLQRLRISRGEDVGVAIYCMIVNGILLREPTDEPSDFWDLGSI